jgi:uncharacterized ParB-like nuclease family protein
MRAKITTLNIDDIGTDQEFQMRVSGYDHSHIQDTLEDFQDGKDIPPIEVVWLTDERRYQVVEGFHRLRAQVHLGRFEIEVKIVGELPRKEALIWTLKTVNDHKAKKLNREDKESKLMRILRLEPSLLDCSYREIGRECGLSAPFVKKIIEKNKVEIQTLRDKTLTSAITTEELWAELKRRVASVPMDIREDIARTVRDTWGLS